MRVAVLVSSFPVVSETFIARQIAGLIDAGHAVDVFAEVRPDADAPLHPEMAAVGLRHRTIYVNEQLPVEAGYWELPVYPLWERTWVPGHGRSQLNLTRLARAIPSLARCWIGAPRAAVEVMRPSLYGYQARSLSSLYRLRLLLDHGGYDIVHAHFGPTADTFKFVRDLWKAPVVASFHGYDYTAVPSRDGLEVYHPLFERVDLVTANSEYARSRLEELGCASDRLELLRYGIDLAEFAACARVATTGPARVLTVGRLVEKKGIDHALRGLARVISERSIPLRYDIVGDGPLRADLERLVGELGLTGYVKFHGSQGSARVRELMRDADVFLLTSVTAVDGDQEGTPVVLLEAQACALPVLSTLHSGIPEIVRDGESGYLVPERDDVALADRLAHLLTHPELRTRMGAAGRAHIETYHDLDRLNRDLVSIYERALERVRRPEDEFEEA